MTTMPNKDSNELLVGYFASVTIALIASSLLAAFLADQLSYLSTAFPSVVWRSYLAAGLFIAVAFCNPVGTYLTKGSVGRALVRLGVGFVGGLVIQILFISPVAGNGMSQVILLLIAGIAVPLAAVTKRLQMIVQSRGIVPGKRVADALLRILSWPDRILFVLMMGVCFSLFWQFEATPNQIMAVLAGVLIALTLWVTMRQVPELIYDDPEDAERRAWLALDPVDETSGPGAAAIIRLKTLSHRVLPGAILFGGVTRLAVDFLFMVYPDLHIDFADPVSAAQSIGIVVASGLGVIFFGMMASLGFCLLLTQMIGRFKGWSAAHLRENYVHLIRAMYFRPMDRV